MVCVGLAVPYDRGKSPHLCSHLLHRRGLILSHYCRRCRHTAHTATRASVQLLDHAVEFFFFFFSSGWPPEQTIKKTKLLSWALTKCTGALEMESPKEKYVMLYYPFHLLAPFSCLPVARSFLFFWTLTFLETRGESHLKNITWYVEMKHLKANIYIIYTYNMLKPGHKQMIQHKLLLEVVLEKKSLKYHQWPILQNHKLEDSYHSHIVLFLTTVWMCVTVTILRWLLCSNVELCFNTF